MSAKISLLKGGKPSYLNFSVDGTHGGDRGEVAFVFTGHFLDCRSGGRCDANGVCKNANLVKMMDIQTHPTFHALLSLHL